MDTEKLKSYLLNPYLFKLITEVELSKVIVGEKEARKVIFLSACGRLVKNCQIASFNLLVNDSSGTGKDYVTEKTLSILPKDSCVKKTRISPAVFTYWHNHKYEPEWTWEGKVFYAEDMSEPVLNSDVFKVMCSSGSQATIVIKQRACDIDIIGKPIVIVTTASATPSPELTRRFSIINLTSSVEQTAAIMKRQSEYREKGIVPELDKNLIEAQKLLNQVSVKIPFATLIYKHFPTDNLIMRTLYPRFLDYINASCALYQFQRKKDVDGFYSAEKQDYEIAREVFIALCNNKYMIPLTFTQRKMLDIFENAGSMATFSATEVLPMLKGILSSLSSVQNNLRILASYGLLSEQIEKDRLNHDVEKFQLPSNYNLLDKLKIPTFEEMAGMAMVEK